MYENRSFLEPKTNPHSKSCSSLKNYAKIELICSSASVLKYIVHSVHFNPNDNIHIYFCSHNRLWKSSQKLFPERCFPHLVNKWVISELTSAAGIKMWWRSKTSFSCLTKHSCIRENVFDFISQDVFKSREKHNMNWLCTFCLHVLRSLSSADIHPASPKAYFCPFISISSHKVDVTFCFGRNNSTVTHQRITAPTLTVTLRARVVNMMGHRLWSYMSFGGRESDKQIRVCTVEQPVLH